LKPILAGVEEDGKTQRTNDQRAVFYKAPELLRKDEIEDKALIDLWGVVKVSEATMHGISFLNFDAFAPAARWEELSMFGGIEHRGSATRQEEGAA
jgi:hypothetical protein